MSLQHPRDTELAERKQQLLIRSAVLRVSLAHQAQVLRGPLAMADTVRNGTQWLRRRPQWPLAALALLALLALRRPRRALRWATRLWWGWHSYQRFQQWLDKQPRQRP